jgi:hypothetical protein
MTFVQRRNRLTTRFWEGIPVDKRRMTVLKWIKIFPVSKVNKYSALNKPLNKRSSIFASLISMAPRLPADHVILTFPSSSPPYLRHILHTTLYRQCMLHVRFTSGTTYLIMLIIYMPILVTVRPKVWDWSRILAGIAGSDPAEEMDVRLLWGSFAKIVKSDN